jgi:hypothetical protein
MDMPDGGKDAEIGDEYEFVLDSPPSASWIDGRDCFCDCRLVFA